MSYTESQHIAEVYAVLIFCSDVSIVETLMTYTLFCYIAELFPNL